MEAPERQADTGTRKFPLAEIGGTTTSAAGPSDHPKPGRHDDGEALLDLLELWEERYRAGETATPESLGVTEPKQIEALRALIARQTRLYARLQCAGAPTETAAVGDEPLPSFPNHETLEKIGQGGMGVVYKSRDQKLGRVVAIKTIAEGQNATPDQRERFRAEAQAVARLRHPNIIAIHAVGEHENRPYLSLEFAERGSLSQKMAKGPTSTREAAELIEKLARAMLVAHEAGIVHRDLKPSNVLLTAEGVPKVSDFGLAKLLDADSARTLSGQVLGSPSYMAPEQAEGHAKQVGPAADIYALGAILYQALTGKPPFLGESQLETLKLVTTAEVVPPRRLRPEVPRDLETICLKCLQKEPTKRYTNAGALAEDLRRFLDGHAILARRASRPELVVLWCKRNPWVAFSFVALCVGTALTSWLAIQATVAGRAASAAEAATGKERDRAELSRDRAFRAVQAIVLTDNDQMGTEEALPYRQMLLEVGLDLSREIQQESAGDARAEEVLADALIMQTKILAAKGEWAPADEVGRRAVAMFEELVAHDQAIDHKNAVDHPSGKPGATPAVGKRTQIRSRELLARLRHQLAFVASDNETGRKAARESNEVYTALLIKNPQAQETKDWINRVALNLQSIGNRYFRDAMSAKEQVKVELLHKAIDAFSEAVEFCKEYVDRENEPGVVLAPLAYNERYLCRAFRALAEETNDPLKKAHNFDEADAHGRKSISHFESILVRNPDHYQYSLDLHDAEREMGIVFQSMARWDQSIQWNMKARETLKAMKKRHDKVVSRVAALQDRLAVDDHNLIKVVLGDKVPHEALLQELTDEAYTICDKLDVVLPLPPSLRQVYAFVTFLKSGATTESTGLPDVDLARKAEQLYASLLDENADSDYFRYFVVLTGFELADGLSARGQGAEAKRVDTKALKAAEGHSRVCFDTAWTYASNAREAVEKPNKLNAQQKEALRRRYARRVVPMLRAAVDAGFKDAALVRKSTEFDAFRSDPAFQAVVMDMEFPDKPLPD